MEEMKDKLTGTKVHKHGKAFMQSYAGHHGGDHIYAGSDAFHF